MNIRTNSPIQYAIRSCISYALGFIIARSSLGYSSLYSSLVIYATIGICSELFYYYYKKGKAIKATKGWRKQHGNNIEKTVSSISRQ